MLLLSRPAEARTVALFFALDADWKAFQEAVGGGFRTKDAHGFLYYDGLVAGDRVVATKMGSGCVTTAVSAARLLGAVRCDVAVSVGPVGSLSNDLQPHTWGLVKHVVPWQTASGERAGESPKNMAWPQPERIQGKALTELRTIRVASGELFVDSEALRSRIRLLTDCDAVDMNLFGLLRALEVAKVPSIHLRIVSDWASEGAGEEFQQFLDRYDGEGGKKVAAWLQSLPPDETSLSHYPELQNLLNEGGKSDEPSSEPLETKAIEQ